MKRERDKERSNMKYLSNSKRNERVDIPLWKRSTLIEKEVHLGVLNYTLKEYT